VPDAVSSEFPLFPLGMVALPHEVVPLHIFEERYKQMMEFCLREGHEFGIVWLADDGLRDVGCACAIDRVLERMDDGRMNLLTRGTRPFRVLERQGHLPYPAGVVEFLSDAEEAIDGAARDVAHSAYDELVQEAADRRLDADELAAMDAYAMAATVDFGVEAKQQLLELRSETARLRLLARLLRAALKRLQMVELAGERAKSNGKVRFT
jgi:Lon protease-like protein